MISLVFADTGTQYIVQKISGSTEIKQHLMDLGINPGAVIKIITSLAGNLILDVKGSRVGIGQNLVKKIFVKEVTT